MKKLPVLVLASILTLVPAVLPKPALANISVATASELKDVSYVKLTNVDNEFDEMPNKIVVSEDIRHYETMFYELKSKDVTLTILNRRATMSFGTIAGLTSKHSIYLFSYPKNNPWSTRKVLGHEMGHLIQDIFMTQQDYFEFLLLRHVEPTRLGYFDTPNELLAEDFYYLFNDGGDKTYYPSYPVPNEKERQWFISKIRGK